MKRAMHKSLIENLNEVVEKRVENADINWLAHFFEARLSQRQIIWNSQRLKYIFVYSSCAEF